MCRGQLVTVSTLFSFLIRRLSPLLLALLLLGPVAAQHRRPAAGKRKPATSKGNPKSARQKARSQASRRAEAPAPRRRTGRTARQAAPKSKAQLERERQDNLSRIAEAGQVLTQTTQKKQATLGQLNVIKEKLTVKQGQIQHISTQLQGIETNVHQTARQVLSTQERDRKSVV